MTKTWKRFDCPAACRRLIGAHGTTVPEVPTSPKVACLTETIFTDHRRKARSFCVLALQGRFKELLSQVPRGGCRYVNLVAHVTGEP